MKRPREAREIASAIAEAKTRMRSTWLECDGSSADDARTRRRVEINFPLDREEYERLREETRDWRASNAKTIASKLRDGGERPGGADDGGDDGEWAVAAEREGGETRETRETTTRSEDGDDDGERREKWVQSYDEESEEYYYFHSVTHETTWERPSGVEIILDEIAFANVAKERGRAEAEAKAERERAFAEARVDADVTEDALKALKAHTSVDVTKVKLPSAKSWYYEDDTGTWQGPFSAAQLVAWRSMLPMDLRLFEHGNDDAESTLADVLGDAPLIAQCAALGVVLPPRSTAAYAQRALREARVGGVVPEYDDVEDEAPPKSEWEKAILEGMAPEHAIMRGADPADIARQLIERRVAEQEVSYGAAGVYNKFLHKITDASTIAKPTSVYGAIGLDRYVDTRTLDEALHAMKNRVPVKLTKKQIEILKRRKALIKDRINNEWLRTDD